MCCVSLFVACGTEQDWIDTGVSSPYHDCSIAMYQRLDCTGFKRTKNSGGGLQHLFEYAG